MRFRRLIAAVSLVVAAATTSLPAADRPAGIVYVEAESFEKPGGWCLDTQFIQIMGSPYLLAHGLGTPVEDATTVVRFAEPGEYRVFVRTKD
ncbi:MAG: FAD-dependent oxidoreductase, partial [Thermoguttaceae bacterium]